MEVAALPSIGPEWSRPSLADLRKSSLATSSSWITRIRRSSSVRLSEPYTERRPSAARGNSRHVDRNQVYSFYSVDALLEAELAVPRGIDVPSASRKPSLASTPLLRFLVPLLPEPSRSATPASRRDSIEIFTPLDVKKSLVDDGFWRTLPQSGKSRLPEENDICPMLAEHMDTSSIIEDISFYAAESRHPSTFSYDPEAGEPRTSHESRNASEELDGDMEDDDSGSDQTQDVIGDPRNAEIDRERAEILSPQHFQDLVAEYRAIAAILDDGDQIMKDDESSVDDFRFVPKPLFFHTGSDERVCAKNCLVPNEPRVRNADAEVAASVSKTPLHIRTASFEFASNSIKSVFKKISPLRSPKSSPRQGTTDLIPQIQTSTLFGDYTQHTTPLSGESEFAMSTLTPKSPVLRSNDKVISSRKIGRTMPGFVDDIVEMRRELAGKQRRKVLKDSIRFIGEVDPGQVNDCSPPLGPPPPGWI